MKLPAIAISALAVLVLPSVAASDPIAVRQSLMSSVGANTGVAGGMMKGEIPYNPTVAKGAIAALNASAVAFGDYFPEGSQDASRSEASPKIWEDMEGFTAVLTKFQESSAAAMEAAGKQGPADVEAFKAAVGPVLENCKSCHEKYRVDK